MKIRLQTQSHAKTKNVKSEGLSRNKSPSKRNFSLRDAISQFIFLDIFFLLFTAREPKSKASKYKSQSLVSKHY